MSRVLVAIVACDRDGVIGCDGKMLWNLPADMKHFRETTMGHPIVMGRVTYESIGKPLSGRDNIVLSRSGDIDGVSVFSDHEKALEYAFGLNDRVYVIGGEAIYDLYMGRFDEVIMTRIDHSFGGDRSFNLVGDWELDCGSSKRFGCGEFDIYRLKRLTL